MTSFIFLFLLSVCWGTYYQGLNRTYSEEEYKIVKLEVLPSLPKNKDIESIFCALSEQLPEGPKELIVTLCPTCCPCKL